MQVYAEHTAGRTFLHALADMLGSAATSAACLDRVDELLSAPRSHSPGRAVAADREPRRQEQGDVATGAQDSSARIVDMLLDVLACDSADGAPCSDLIAAAPARKVTDCRLLQHTFAPVEMPCLCCLQHTCTPLCASQHRHDTSTGTARLGGPRHLGQLGECGAVSRRL